MVEKQSNLYSNDQICIQTIEFKFKWITQEVTYHYRPPALGIGDSADGIAQTVAPAPAPMRTLPPTSGRRQP
jgi:hypothetical protein